MEIVDVARKFIELDSTPDTGTFEIAEFAAGLAKSIGLAVELQAESHNGLAQANVIIRPTEGLPNDELLLQTHLDTSDPGAYGWWTKTGANPFNASIYLDTVYGLGAASKLDFICKLMAIKELLAEKKPARWRMPFVLVGTYGEEIGMPGAVKLIRKKKINARQALVGEPTEMALVTAGKGFAGVEIEIPFSAEEQEFRRQHNEQDGTTSQSRVFLGKAAHSSNPQMGESALVKMFDYLAKLPSGLAVIEIEGGINYNTVPAHAVLEIDMVGEMQDSMAAKLGKVAAAITSLEQEFKRFPDQSFVPPEPTLNVGMIRTYEDFIKISGCCRWPRAVSDDVYGGWMEILRQACVGVGAAFRVTDYKQPFRTPIPAPFVEVCQDLLQKMGHPSDLRTQSVANEANVFSRFGIECVALGPGRGVGNSHAPNEHVKIDELHEAIRFYRSVLEKMCL